MSDTRQDPPAQPPVPTRKLDLSRIATSPPRGGASFLPQTMEQCLDFATIMSKSDFAIPPKFRGNVGACLAVVIQSSRWGADPFGVVQKAYVTKAKDGSERLAYEAQAVAAIVNTTAPIIGRLSLRYSGQGPTRKLKVIGTFVYDPEPKELETPEIKNIKIKNSPLWESDPDQQLAYYGQRAWGRRWCPEVLLGIYTPEEIEEARIVEAPRPVRQVAVTEGEKPEDLPEGVVRASEEEPARESQDVLEAAEALVPDAGDVETETEAPITRDEARTLDETRINKDEEEGDGGASAAFTEWEGYLEASKQGLQEFSKESELDEYADRTKLAIKNAEGLTDDERDDLRARFVSAFLNRKKDLGFGGRRR